MITSPLTSEEIATYARHAYILKNATPHGIKWLAECVRTKMNSSSHYESFTRSALTHLTNINFNTSISWDSSRLGRKVWEKAHNSSSPEYHSLPDVVQPKYFQQAYTWLHYVIAEHLLNTTADITEFVQSVLQEMAPIDVKLEDGITIVGFELPSLTHDIMPTTMYHHSMPSLPPHLTRARTWLTETEAHDLYCEWILPTIEG